MTPPPRTAKEMESIIERLISVPREVLDALLAVTDLALAELDRSGDDMAAYQVFYHRLRDYLDRDGRGHGGDLKRLGAPAIAGEITNGREAVLAKLHELGLRDDST